MDEERWQAVLATDGALDGSFVYAVRSTGVYCRTTCPSRRPRRENVQFFDTPALAEAAGFRPCKRCHPQGDVPDPAGEVVEQICAFIREQGAPSLAELGAQFHLSPAHLQRLFKRVTGLSPRQYAEVCRLDRLKRELREGESVTDAQNEAGYSSSSRLYERAPGQLGMSPKAYQKGGAAQVIRYTIFPSAIGLVLLAATERGICALRLADGRDELLAVLSDEFPRATLVEDPEGLAEWAAIVANDLTGAGPLLRLPLDLQATAFQLRVWEVLRRIPAGETRTYQEVAEAIGQPTAARAAARAIATNPVALAIPCHRVIRGDGGMGGYRWGLERKRELLALERK
jgi:AraC family transcriptional regulator of adaptative response/methylated-DNA-[protein]-cysteine methyltransferase